MLRATMLRTIMPGAGVTLAVTLGVMIAPSVRVVAKAPLNIVIYSLVRTAKNSSEKTDSRLLKSKPCALTDSSAD